jgi:signal peptidase I
VNRTAAEQRAHLAREVVETLLFVGLVFLIVHVTMQAFRVTSNKMAPQLQPSQFVLVNKAAYLLGSPGRGDVVIFASPCSGDSDHPLVGRVIAVPGDTVTLTATSVAVNGVTLTEPYVKVPTGTAENAVVVPSMKLNSDQYYILDDNRAAGSGDPSNCQQDSDSRSFGTVPRQNIQGKAVLVFWPFGVRHWVGNYSDVFSGVNK